MNFIAAKDGLHCAPASFEMIFDAAGKQISQSQVVQKGSPWINPNGTMPLPHWPAPDKLPVGTRGVEAVCLACGFSGITVDLVVDNMNEVEKQVAAGAYAILFMSDDANNQHHAAPYDGRNATGDHMMICPTSGRQPIIPGRTVRACCIKGL